MYCFIFGLNVWILLQRIIWLYVTNTSRNPDTMKFCWLIKSYYLWWHLFVDRLSRGINSPMADGFFQGLRRADARTLSVQTQDSRKSGREKKSWVWSNKHHFYVSNRKEKIGRQQNVAKLHTVEVICVYVSQLSFQQMCCGSPLKQHFFGSQSSLQAEEGRNTRYVKIVKKNNN